MFSQVKALLKFLNAYDTLFHKQMSDLHQLGPLTYLQINVFPDEWLRFINYFKFVVYPDSIDMVRNTVFIFCISPNQSKRACFWATLQLCGIQHTKPFWGPNVPAIWILCCFQYSQHKLNLKISPWGLYTIGSKIGSM